MRPQQNPKAASTPKWAFDKTLNIPTLLTIGAMVAGAATVGVNAFSARDQRSSDQDRRIDAVERKADSAADNIKRVEALQAMQAQTQDVQLQALRNEFRNDLKDISGKLDTLLMNQATNRPETRGWTK
jgi:hypothetical protein